VEARNIFIPMGGLQACETRTLHRLRENINLFCKPAFLLAASPSVSAQKFLRRSRPAKATPNPYSDARGSGNSFSEKSHSKTSLPHECKPFCVNPTPFPPTTRRRLCIHIRKSLKAGTSEEETEKLNQLVRRQGLSGPWRLNPWCDTRE